MHEVSALVWPVRFCQGPVSAPTRAVCVLSRHGPGGFPKKTPQLRSLHFCWLHGQVHLSIQPLDCPFALLVSLWRGSWSRRQMTGWFPNPGSPHQSPCGWRPCLDTKHVLYWFPLLPCWIVQPQLRYCSWPLVNQNPDTALFLMHWSISASGLLCFHSGFKSIGSYLHLPLSVRHHTFSLHCGEGLRKPIFWLKLYIFIVFLSTVNPALSSLLPSTPQGKTLALPVKSAK